MPTTTGHVGINDSPRRARGHNWSARRRAVELKPRALRGDQSIDDVRAAEERLRARGATFAYEGVVPHREGAHSGGIFFEDPDGTRLEIYAKDGAAGAAPVTGAPTCGFF